MTPDTNIYERFLAEVVGAFVEHPDMVQVIAVPWPQKLSVTLEVAPSDFGSVCGKNGKMFYALKVLLLSKASHEGDSVEFRLIEPKQRGVSSRNIPNIPDMSWSGKQDIELGKFLVGILDQCLQTPATVEITNIGTETIFTVVPTVTIIPEVLHALHTLLRAIGRIRRRKIVINSRPA